jgi:hypothetical protein
MMLLLSAMQVIMMHPVLNADSAPTLQLLVLQLAFQLLRLGHLPDRLVEVVLGDRVPVVLDSE